MRSLYMDPRENIVFVPQNLAMMHDVHSDARMVMVFNEKIRPGNEFIGITCDSGLLKKMHPRKLLIAGRTVLVHPSDPMFKYPNDPSICTLFVPAGAFIHLSGLMLRKAITWQFRMYDKAAPYIVRKTSSDGLRGVPSTGTAVSIMFNEAVAKRDSGSLTLTSPGPPSRLPLQMYPSGIRTRLCGSQFQTINLPFQD